MARSGGGAKLLFVCRNFPQRKYVVAMRICRDLIVSLRYKLRMFGLNLQGPAYTFCDNAGVVKNVSIPESVLHKRHNAINYHIIRESVAAEIMQVGKEDTKTNLSDLLVYQGSSWKSKEFFMSVFI